MGAEHDVTHQILTGSDAHSAVAKARGDLVVYQVLLRGHASTRHFGPQHEHVGLSLTLALALLTRVAVLLLVHAVELEDLGISRGKSRCHLFHFLGNAPAQEVTALFDCLGLSHNASPLISIKSIDIKEIMTLSLFAVS